MADFTPADLDRASLFVESRPYIAARSVAQLMADERERNAKLCDEVVRNRRDYSVEQRALARKLAEQMRGGGR